MKRHEPTKRAAEPRAELPVTLDAAGEPYLCCECDDPAVYFCYPKADHDPYCAKHFAETFAECQSCGRTIMQDDPRDVLTARATRLDPAEYVSACVHCAPDEDDDRCQFDTIEERDDYESEMSR